MKNNTTESRKAERHEKRLKVMKATTTTTTTNQNYNAKKKLLKEISTIAPTKSCDNIQSNIALDL